MKWFPFLSLPVIGIFVSGCDAINRPISSGDFDPLNAPGSGANHVNVVDANNNTFKPGQFVKTAMDNAAFFKQRPKGDADADRLLHSNMPMKVISSDGSYLKVELDSGEVGYIPSVMVVDQSAVETPMSGATQVAPLPPGASPKDPVPASGTPAEAIPTSIDPEAPATAPPATEPKKDAPAEGAPTPSATDDGPKKAPRRSSAVTSRAVAS